MTGLEQRKIWVDSLIKIAGPVLESLSRRKLHQELPVEFHKERAKYAMLEAFGRTLCGIAPWLDAEGLSPEEEALRSRYANMALEALDAATDPSSPDFMYFDGDDQPLVDAAFLCHGLLRAPKNLIDPLDDRVRENLVRALRSSRKIVPYSCNWIFFSAMVEAGLYRLGAQDYDLTRAAYAVRSFEEWYKGDGVYGDGMAFHWDYYNSFVIQPMYLDVLRTFSPLLPEFAALQEKVTGRAARYAAVLERLIAPDGTYPILGRSICYRFGAFQLLSQAALQHFLPEEVSPAQVRCALTAVIQRVMEAPSLFDEKGWLLPGVYGNQPSLAEGYINRGSLYLCSGVFLPLGLAPQDAFWNSPEEDWTARKIWAGVDMPRDHAIDF